MNNSEKIERYLEDIDLAFEDWSAGDSSFQLPGTPISSRNPEQRFESWAKSSLSFLKGNFCPRYLDFLSKNRSTVEVVNYVHEALSIASIPIASPLAASVILVKKYGDKICKGLTDQKKNNTPTKNIIAENRRVSVKFHGNGKEQILLVHGIPTSSLVWRPLMSYFDKGEYELIVPDLLGFGDSESGFGCDYSIRNQAKVLSHLCKELGTDRISVIAHDLGVIVVLYALWLYPNLFSSIVLLNTSDLSNWLVPPVQKIVDSIDDDLLKNVKDFFQNRLKKAISNESYNYEIIDELSLYFSNKHGAHLLKLILEALTKNDYLNAQKGLYNLSQPALVVWGTRDHYLSTDIGKNLAKKIINSEYIEIESAGHFPQLDEPQKLYHIIQKFLEDART